MHTYIEVYQIVMYVNNLFYDVIIVKPCFEYNDTGLSELSLALAWFKIRIYNGVSDKVKKSIYS